ncbi:MAG: tetratricopeptide repeat protein [Oscillochloris sp.]|nr:tetratricopeptide repeat protein [Oscillochloris sp.]
MRALGPQRGAEELPRQLNLVYDALIAEVWRYCGAVINFAGDAITCWFADEQADAGGESQSSAALRAATCGLALQRVMQNFAAITIEGAGTVRLAIKVGIACGAVQRFVVGSPEVQLLDVMAGDTLQRMAAAEHQAQQGEVVIDAACAAVLGAAAQPGAQRTDENGQHFVVLNDLAAVAHMASWPNIAATDIPEAVWRQWLIPPVYERLNAGLGDFLTELRPATALFLRFGGIDFDHDPLAEEKLNSFILWAQRVLQRYDAYMLQLTVGDKGSFFYASFGAPVAHEDDPARAILAALELREPRFSFIEPVQIGLSLGRCRTGAYGGQNRRTYGVLGDEVNMAARLMQAAQPGQVIVSPALRRATGERFSWEMLPPRQVKGKSEPVTPYRLIGMEQQRIRLHEPRYTLPMVGRQSELQFILARLNMVERGQGQAIGVSAEAGMGKSRLVAEVLQAAQLRRLLIYGGEAQSYGTNTPYLAWRSIWHGFFGLDDHAAPVDQIATLNLALARIDPALLPRLPLLGPVLGLEIPDNSLTRDFDARLRKESLEALLVSCLRARAAELPVLIVLEDCHWLDVASRDLLEVVARAVTSLPVLILMAYRPPQVPQLGALAITALPHFRAISLDHLTVEEVTELVRLKLSQWLGDEHEAPTELLDRVNARAQGNPFYVEELLNYIRDQGVDPQDAAAIDRLDLPTSLQSLVLSRIDRLSESQKTLIKVASVIGRLFRAAVLWGVSAFFGQQERVRRELEQLSAIELTPLDTPDPELTYLFKHIVTQEVTYESLPFATRAVLHEQIAQHLEAVSGERNLPIDLLAFHYDRSENQVKRREYLRRAGEAAQAIYANSAAIDYYSRLLALLPEDAQVEPLLRLGQVQETVGEWDAADGRYQRALAIAEGSDDRSIIARCRALCGELRRKQGRYTEARQWIERALAEFSAGANRAGLAETLNYAGNLALHQGEYALAGSHYEACLTIQREIGDTVMGGRALSNLGIIAFHQGNAELARRRFEESLAVRRAVGNPLWIANSLGNLGMLAIEAGDYAAAQPFVEESLGLERATGDRAAIAISLNNLAKIQIALGDSAGARRTLAEALMINRDLADQWALAYLLEDSGVLAARVGAPEQALRLAAAAAALRNAIGGRSRHPNRSNLTRHWRRHGLH